MLIAFQIPDMPCDGRHLVCRSGQSTQDKIVESYCACEGGLSGVKVNLCGLQTLTLPSAADAGGNRQVYNILASDHGAADLRLLTADSAVGPAFRGLLSVCESYGAAVAATASPGGLAQGFQPPGSKTQEAPEDGKTSSRRRKRKTSTSKLKWRTWR
ncbi:CD3e molecule, epsilon associated protein isoform X3 [Syngnathoides biaculeatus]|uniref:CD3e molecule, epsilon associated protein isoform X3 n=1 Tax=Syngnathoides biaculeatus TaxID=300417 RepID=UPI002ADD825E|nr:CD3e molecule, epsilon associated protein isoform X3 [Syngnathoides biaculeatus]